MSKRLARETHQIYTGAVRNVAVDFTGLLDDGETLSGTPTVTDDSGEFVLSNKQVSTTALVIRGNTVAIGKAVQFTVDRNGAADGEYELDIVASTSAGQTLPASVTIECV